MRHEPHIIAAGHRAGRHYGMDWLRIGAFGLLIAYHIAMVFAPWHWVVKSATTYPALIPPMAILTPWRLALLFAVSGYASAKLFARSGDIAGFLRGRSSRLLLPLAFGMAVLVPIEMWVRVRSGGYPDGYLHFWAGDYWRAGTFYGVAFPSWEHLWFVAYLWAYTMVLGLVLALGGRARVLVDWLCEGSRLFWVPIAAMVTAKLALMFVIPEKQGLLSDWGGHAEYGPMFAFGFVLAGHERLWPVVARAVKPALIAAIVGGAVMIAVEFRYPAESVPPHAIAALERASRIAMAWSMTLLLFHGANRWLDRDHRWRGALARAVFPAYLLHHPAIVLVAWWTLPLGFAAPLEFAILAAASLGACWLGYAVGTRVPAIGTLIGLPKR